MRLGGQGDGAVGVAKKGEEEEEEDEEEDEEDGCGDLLAR